MKRRKLIKNHPAQEATRVAEVWLEKGKLKKAKESFLKALSYDPRYEPAIIQLASLALKNGENGLAAKYFEEIALLAIQAHLYLKGVAALKRALQYNPDNATLREQLKMLLMELGRNEEAESLDLPPVLAPPTVEVETIEPPIISMEGDVQPNECLKEEAPASVINNSTEEITEEKGDIEDIDDLNLADLTEEEIDYLAEVEVLIVEGDFYQADKLLTPLKEKYPENGYIKLVSYQIRDKDFSSKSFLITESKDPEIDLSGSLK